MHTQVYTHTRKRKTQHQQNDNNTKSNKKTGTELDIHLADVIHEQHQVHRDDHFLQT